MVVLLQHNYNFISYNNRSSLKSKRIDIMFLVVKERVQSDLVSIERTRTNTMVADPLTKSLTLTVLMSMLLVWPLVVKIPLISRS